MTVTTTNSRITYVGDGSTTVFPFPYYFLLATDLVVYVNSVLQPTGYNVSGAGQDSGGNVNFTVAPAVGATIIILRDPDKYQNTKLPPNDPFPAKLVETGLDKLTMLVQRIYDRLTRIIQFPDVDTNSVATLPAASARVSQLLGFDSLGNPSMYPVTASVGAGDMRVDTFTAGIDFTTAGTTTQLTLSRAPGNPANLEIFFDGAFQGPDQWSLSGAVVTFTSAIPAGISKVFARSGTTLSTQIPPTKSVGDSQLIWGTSLGKVVSTRAELKALDTTTYQRAFVLGYSAAGDLGGLGPVYFSSTSALADNGGSITTPNVGSGNWLMMNTSRLNPFMFGAKGDKVTDDTAAIQACYNAVPIGGTFRLPVAPGLAYIVSTQPGGYCLDFSRFVHIEAEGFFSALQPAAGTTSNTVRLKPVVGGGYWGMKWEGLTLGDPFTGTRAGLNGIFIDTQVDGSQLPAGIFRNLNVMTGSVVGGVGILHINSSVGANINGGMYGTSFEDCIVKGGFNLQGSGDSNVIKRALISGPNVGVYFSLTAGASLLTLEDCNITSTGGAVLADSGSRFKMYHCNCEQIQPFTQSITGFTTDCMVNVRGSNGTMSTPEIVGNHFGLFSGVPNSAVVRINNVIGGKADGNVLLNSNSAPTGFIVSNSTNFRIGDGNTYGTAIVTTGAKVSDTGTGTMGVYKPLASTLINAWSQSPVSPTATFVSFKTCAGEVIVDGKLSGGTVTSGTAFAMLPAGHAPLETREFPVVTYNGATLVPGHVRIETDGTMRIMSGQNTAMYLSGIRFMAADLADATSDL